MNHKKRSLLLVNTNSNYLLLVLSVFTCTYFIYRDIGIGNTVGWFFSFVLLGLFLIARDNVHIRVSVASVCWLTIVLFILLSFFREGSRRDNDEIIYAIAMISATIFMLCSEPNWKEIKLCQTFFIMISFAIGGLIVFFKFFTSMYWVTLYKVIAESPRELAAYYVPRGYGIPIGGSLTIADYIMMMGVLTLFTRYLNEKSAKNTKGKLVHLIAIVFLLFAFVAEGRRGELVAVMVAMLVVFLISKTKRELFVKLLLIGSFALVVVLMFNILLALFMKSPVLYRYAMSIQGILEGDDVTSGRTELWKQAIIIFRKHPVFGVGFGGFANSVSSSFLAIHGEDVRDVHNCFLQLLCETGIVGTTIIGLPLLIMFLQTLKTAVRNTKHKANNDISNEIVQISQISVGIQAFFFCVSMLDPAFYKPIFWCFYAIAIVLSEYARKLDYRVNHVQRNLINSLLNA